MKNKWVGKWICRDGTKAEIFDRNLGTLCTGVVKICNRDIFTLWDTEGNHFSAWELDLVRREREAEI